MGTYGSLSQEDLAAVRSLEKRGLDGSTATAVVVLSHHQPARTIEGLAEYLRQYPRLARADVSTAAVADLKQREWLRPVDLPGAQPLFVALPNLLAVADATMGEPRLGDIPSARPLGIHLSDLGPISEPLAYTAYLDALSSAQASISCVAMRPDPSSAAASLLIERALAGVDVRVVLASDRVVRDLWGGGPASTYGDYLERWCKLDDQTANLEVRISHDSTDMLFASCAAMDGKRACLDVFDFEHHATLDGLSVHVWAREGLRPNLVTQFCRTFEQVWSAAHSRRRSTRILQILSKQWQLAAFVVAVLIALAVDGEIAKNISAGVAATFLVNAAAASWPDIRQLLRRLLIRASTTLR